MIVFCGCGLLKRYQFWLVGWLIVGFKANCPLVGPGPIGRMPSVWVFLRDPTRIYTSFGENHDINSDPSILDEDYVNMDQNVAVCGEMSDVDTIAQLKENNQAEVGLCGEEENKEIQEKPLLSAAEVLENIEFFYLSNFFFFSSRFRTI